MISYKRCCFLKEVLVFLSIWFDFTSKSGYTIPTISLQHVVGLVWYITTPTVHKWNLLSIFISNFRSQSLNRVSFLLNAIYRLWIGGLFRILWSVNGSWKVFNTQRCNLYFVDVLMNTERNFVPVKRVYILNHVIH